MPAGASHSFDDIGPGKHLCGLYETDEEYGALLVSFLRQGLERGEKVVCIAWNPSAGFERQSLSDAGLDADPFLRSGQLLILPAEDIYLRNAVFDPEGVIALLKAGTDLARSEGYRALRVAGGMRRAPRGIPGAERLTECESRINAFFAESRCAALCLYDRTTFPPETLLEILAAHPATVIGRRVYDNFYYLPPGGPPAGPVAEDRLRRWMENLTRRGEELRKSHESLNALVQACPVPIIALDAEGRVTMWNPAAERIFGWSEAEVLGRFNPLVPEEKIGEFRGLLQRLLRGEVFDGLKVRRRRKDGSPVEVSVSTAPLRDADGAITGIMSVLVDLTAAGRAETERRNLEDRLRQSQRIEAVARLAGGVAHRLNSLMAVITGHGPILFDRLDLNDSRRKSVAEIVRAGERAAALIRDLLAFSRRLMLQPKAVSLNDLLEEMRFYLRGLLADRIELEVLPDLGLDTVFVDPERMKEAIEHLVANARDAMAHGGKLVLQTSNVALGPGDLPEGIPMEPGAYVTLTVSDTGTGMNRETRFLIFEPFFTTKPRGEGEGLGLASVYGFVKQSGGYISVESEAGHGTTVTIYLRPALEPTPGSA